MGFLIFRGVSTESLTNVYVAKMPSHKKAGMRYSEYYVKGRDGALHVDEGYENFDLVVTLVLLNASADTRYTVNAWADGTGKLVTSDDPTRAYKASVKSGIEWQRVKAQSVVDPFDQTETYAIGDIVRNGNIVYKFLSAHSGAWDSGDVTTIPIPNGFFDLAVITFNCQPMMVEAVDSQVTFTASGTLLNPGSAVAYPLITVNGSGDAVFSINGNEIQIDDMVSGTAVNIDCENGYVYTASGATSIRGEIPYLDFGTNTVTITSGVTSLVITPHWRWV